jgi:hypothetical protein
MTFGIFDTAVGKEVGIVCRNNRGGFITAKFGTVTKINGHGHIFVLSGDDEYRFHKNGDAYKNERGPSLCKAAALRVEMEREARRKEINLLAREAESVMKSGWTGAGSWFVSKDRVDALKNIVAKMESMVDC